MLNLPWQNASVKLLKKYSYLSKVLNKNIILDKYQRLAIHSLENNQNFTVREKLAFKRDNDYLFYLAHELDYIIDDETRRISYYNNKKVLTRGEEEVGNWLLRLLDE